MVTWKKVKIQILLHISINMNPDKCKVITTFDSKKNKVKKIEYQGQYFVVKKYEDEFIENLHIEKKVLIECLERGITTPKIVDSKPKMLVLEYIPGIDCKSFFDRKEKEEIRGMLESIAAWLADFHEEFSQQRRRGDCILANFIIQDPLICGIDFEEAEQSAPLRDIGDMCTSILRMEPSFTEEKFNLVKYFIDEYFSESSREKIDITEEVVESMLHYSRYGSQRMLMESWAKKIKEVGLDNITQNRV